MRIEQTTSNPGGSREGAKDRALKPTFQDSSLGKRRNEGLRPVSQSDNRSSQAIFLLEVIAVRTAVCAQTGFRMAATRKNAVEMRNICGIDAEHERA